MDITKAQITKIAREVNKLAVKTLKEDGIGTSEFDLIHVVRKHDGITQSDIAKILGLDKGAVARQVARLTKKGFIIKKDNLNDRRSSLIYPTLKAEELKISKRFVENIYYERLLEGLNDEEKETFRFLLEKIYLRSKEESKAGFPHINERLGKKASDFEEEK